MKKIIALLFVSLSVATASKADTFTPSPMCSKPFKPFKFNSQYEIDNFNNQVQSYKQCIMNFIDEQNNAVQKHQEAANDAVDQWNNFVSIELN